jgi:hypothetical protein
MKLYTGNSIRHVKIAHPVGPREAGVTLTPDGTDGTVSEADSLQSLDK